MSNKRHGRRKTRWVVVLPQTARDVETGLDQWIDELLDIWSTPSGVDYVGVPTGLAGSWQDWVNVGGYLRSAMGAVDRQQNHEGAKGNWLVAGGRPKPWTGRVNS